GVLIFILACLVGAVRDGAAGFGTRAAVTGPLMMALGFNPMAAATIALIADSAPVPFGAVGTPVVVGLSNLPDADIALFKEVGIHITALDLFAGTFIPFTI